MTRRVDATVQLLGPAAVVVAVGIATTFVSPSTRIYFLNALVSVAIVVAIYVFVGNSGVLSFGQISFVAVGAFAAGVMTIPLESKTGVLPDLFPLLRDHTIGNVASLLLAAAAGGVVVGGIDRLWTATLGGFTIGFATGVINGALPTEETVFLPSAVFALVIGVLLLRPAGLFARAGGAAVERV